MLFYGWYIVATVAFIDAVIGGTTTLGFTAMVDPIATTMLFTYAQISLATTLRGIESGVMNPFVGALSDRWPAKRLVFIGILLLGLGLICLSQVRNLAMFYLSFIIMGIGGSLGTQMAPMAVMARWFKKNTGKAYGVMAAGVGAGGFLVPFVTRMIDTYGWQRFSLWLGVTVIVIGLPLSFVFRNRPEDYGLWPDGIAPDLTQSAVPVKTQEVSPGVREVVRTRTFWLISLAFMLQVAGGSALMQHIMPYLGLLKIDRTMASMITMFVSIVSIPSRFALGWLCDTFRKSYVAAFSLAASAVGLFLLSIMTRDSLWVIVGFVAFYGVGKGAQLSIMPVIVREEFGSAKFGSIFGLMSVFITAGVVTAPPLSGLVRDIRGNYGPIWVIFGAMSLAGGILLMMVPRALKRPKPATA